MNNPWNVDTIRLSVFIQDATVTQDEQIWENIVGESPEQIKKNPKQALISEMGKYESGVLLINIMPIKIDCIYTVDRDSIPFNNKLPTIGNFEEVIEIYKKIIDKLIKIEILDKYDYNRIAFGSVLLQTVKNKDEGYKLLSDLLPIEIDVENSSDLQYQINRPRKLKINGQEYEINRLSKWGVIELLGYQLNTEGKSAILQSNNDAIRLELDINTSSKYNYSFNLNSFNTFYNHLINLGIEISENGDIP